MAMMVALSVGLRFIQEARADAAAEKLKAMIHVTATVVRNDTAREIPLRDLVPGDIIRLAAGDMIPGDVRLLSLKDLFVSQGSLTGESLPVEKCHEPATEQESSPTELKNTCFMGTSVESGTATAVVVTTGLHTYLGSMARSITVDRPQTSFDKGLNRFTWLMLQFMAVMVPLVFLINGFTKHDWKGAFFFALAVAVGLTPEMLPMIVSVCLAKGALAMSRKRVIDGSMQSKTSVAWISCAPIRPERSRRTAWCSCVIATSLGVSPTIWMRSRLTSPDAWGPRRGGPLKHVIELRALSRTS
jgi:Mg2+-importing ATPase